jgi:toxin ParE1/3/4
MKLRLTRRALADLEAISRYLRARNPPAAEHVEVAIKAALETLIDYPSAGRRQSASGVRKIVTSEYGYIVYYEVNVTLEEISILTIQHGRQERIYEDE